MKKRCSKCGDVKDVDRFYSDSRNPDGLRGQCKDCTLEYNRIRRLSRIAEARLYGRKYYSLNRDRLLSAANDNNRTPRGKIDNAVSGGVSRGIQHGAKNGRSSFQLLGYSLDDLMRHLECLFEPGMSWSNYGFYGWHIDHIKPLASFNYNTPDSPAFKEAWALSNLRPLWAVENWSKGASDNAA